MGDPVTMAMIGAGVGAMTNPRKPLQGALLGGALGGFGGAAGSRGLATNMRRGSVEDLTNMMRTGGVPQTIGSPFRDYRTGAKW